MADIKNARKQKQKVKSREKEKVKIIFTDMHASKCEWYKKNVEEK